MPTSRTEIVPDHWRAFHEATGIPAAVRSVGEVALTGHTGDTETGFSSDPREQAKQTFRNITATLRAAGADWSDVIEMHSFHVGYAAQAPWIVEVARECIPGPLPAWTAVGVVELFEAEALIEISCRAVVDDRRHAFEA